MLDSFAGNREIKEAVKSAVKSGRFPHAFIIEGEEGCGKHTLARIIASAAVCESDDAPCGKCRICCLAEKDGLADIMTYGPDGATFKIDTVREIRTNAHIMPIEAKRKVYILLNCDKMQEPAQNAILKVLEEPPAFTVFILVCRSVSSLLATVRSRCVILTVQNPPEEEALNFLKCRTGKPENEIIEALRSSEGNVGTALEALEGNLDSARCFAADFLTAIKERKRLAALEIMYKYEKDRPGFIAFLGELRVLLGKEAASYALSGSALSPKTIGNMLVLTENTCSLLADHIGKPLYLPVLQTSFCAEIFANLDGCIHRRNVLIYK